MNKKNKHQDGVVYSTNAEYVFQPEENEIVETLTPDKQNLLLYLDTKQRQGKAVTIIAQFVGQTNDLEALGKTLKTKCGVGGSIKDGLIILQGDFRQKAASILTQLGYRNKVR
jgi:translation initiation factor 1